MGPGQAVISVLWKYTTFSGRARRAEYWYWLLIVIVAGLGLFWLDQLLFPEMRKGPILAVFKLVVSPPGLAVAVRRLHDLDRSGWWLLLNLIPILGTLVVLAWSADRGTVGPNRFGADPLAGTGGPPQPAAGASV